MSGRKNPKFSADSKTFIDSVPTIAEFVGRSTWWFHVWNWTGLKWMRAAHSSGTSHFVILTLNEWLLYSIWHIWSRGHAISGPSLHAVLHPCDDGWTFNWALNCRWASAKRRQANTYYGHCRSCLKLITSNCMFAFGWLRFATEKPNS